jgi:hypothetical protein
MQNAEIRLLKVQRRPKQDNKMPEAFSPEDIGKILFSIRGIHLKCLEMLQFDARKAFFANAFRLRV